MDLSLYTLERIRSIIIDCISRNDIGGLGEALQSLNFIDPWRKHRNIILNTNDRMRCSTPLEIAIARNNFVSAEMLVKAGANVNLPQKNSGKTCLHEVVEMMFEKKIDWIEFLLRHGADINSVDNRGNTPLMIASYWRNAPVVQLLIEYGANVHITNQVGKTAYDCAIDTTPREGHGDVNLALATPIEDIVKILTIEEYSAVNTTTGSFLPSDLADMCGDFVFMSQKRRKKLGENEKEL
jgi:hypothetical protein